MKTKEYLQTNLPEQIQSFYNPEADQLIVQQLKQRGAHPDQIRNYIQNNNLKFVLEFAAGVKKTSIEYQMGKDQRIYSGPFQQPVEQLFEQTAHWAGAGSREEAELIGWRKLEQQFQQGATDVVQISPPSQTNSQHGDYGFVFWFERQDNNITNHIMRYGETDRQNLTNSQNLLKSLGYDTDAKGLRDQHFLESPLNVSDLKKQLPMVFQKSGLVFNKQGAGFESALLNDPEIQRLLNYYYQSLDRKQDPIQPLVYLSQLFQLTQIKAAAHGLLDRPVLIPTQDKLKGSCPIVKLGSSNYEYAALLWESVFECPNCGYISFRAVGNQCPGCKITLEQWKEKNPEAEVCD